MHMAYESHAKVAVKRKKVTSFTEMEPYWALSSEVTTSENKAVNSIVAETLLQHCTEPIIYLSEQDLYIFIPVKSKKDWCEIIYLSAYE